MSINPNLFLLLIGTMINPVPNQSQSQPKRRSLSVNAVSRKSTAQSPEPDIELFSNKRDNPLFWTTGSGNSPPLKNPSPPPPSSSSSSSILASSNSKAVLTAGERGRSVSRNSNHVATASSRSSRPRSSSRVDIHAATRSRGRSVSRHPSTLSSESEEVEQRQKFGSKTSWNSSNSTRNQACSVKKPISSPLGNLNTSADTLHFSRRSFRSQSRPHFHGTSHPSPSADSSILNREDDISTGSLSEAEEKTIKAVYEQTKSIKGDNLGGESDTSGIYETVRSELRRAISDIHLDLETAILRSNIAAIASADVTDIPPVLVKPGVVELISEMRRKYATKLDESQERTKKLREDLAVEEHRGQELTRILKETLPDPKTSTSRRSHKGRRTSNERKRMSKRLTDEAISYFDECVSISTFDGSDFSAPEDSAINSIGTTQTSSFPQESPSISNSWGPEGCPSHKQLIHSSKSQDNEDEGRIGGETSRESSRKFHFSSCINNSTENTQEEEEGTRRNSYTIRHIEKEDIIFDNGENATLDSAISSSRCNYYNFEADYGNESLLFDRIHLHKRIQWGSLHLCGGGGGIALSFLSFASLG